MMKKGSAMRHVGCAVAVVLLLAGSGWAAPAAPGAAESERMLRAKDLISEDQWVAAIPLLRAAAADPKEPARDEALFWLAHSQNRVGDFGEAVQSIRRLQGEFPRSRWSAPGYSLLIELAQKLGRQDVLWMTATPPAPPAVPFGPAPLPPTRTRKTPGKPPSQPAPPVPAAVAPAPVPPPAPPVAWLPETYFPDVDLRIQALGSLIHTDPKKVIPMLQQIALEQEDPAAARRAVFLLAQSRNPEAHSTVVEVAKKGPEPVKLVAVRELARFGGEKASKELLQVYSTANLPVKQQVVIVLGDLAETDALVKIARSESDLRVLHSAIIALGRAGGSKYLRGMYASAPAATRQTIVRGLFNARDEEGLIGIADQEKDGEIRKEVLARLRLLGTPRAKAYVENHAK
jgi:hypothetical protein